ncbi:permease [Hapalosiphon sp. MRB220]|nr:permease [Hapalosiphon sp. MRB220]
MNLTLGIILATGVGVSLGLVGSGGSVLAVPILIYVMGVAPKSAIAMSLVIVGVVSLIGAIPHWQQGNVNLKTVALFSPTAMLGTYLGARIGSLPMITPTFQLICFAVLMVVGAILMIRNEDSSDFDHEHQLNYQWLAIPIEGLGVGILTGFVGIGGGFMIIPALVLLGKTPMKEAIGTSLVIISLKSVTGFAGYFGNVPIDFHLMMFFTLAAILGTLAGAYFTQIIQTKRLETGFGLFMIAVAVFIVMKR